MSINSVSGLSNFANINAINIQPKENKIANTESNNLQTVTNEVSRREDVSMLGASFMKMRLQQALTSPNTSSSSSGISRTGNSLSTNGQTNAVTNTPTSSLSISLQPRETFNPQVNSFLQNTLSLPTNKISTNRTIETVNSANQLQSSQIIFKSGGTATSFYTAGFPPTSVATLPRIAFDKSSILSFYKSANPLSATQLQSVQNLYAGDLTSRKNYSTNLANLGKDLTTLRNSPGLDNKSKSQIDGAINKLQTAYNTLSDVNAAAPSPRLIYSQVASVYQKLSSNDDLNQDQKNLVNTGLNILAIGASNYDTNRVPVAGTPITPAPATPFTPSQISAAGFPLPSFDNVRNTPLSTAQASPAQVFGTGVSQYLQSIGLSNIDTQKINYQVNSADKLQFIEVPLGKGRSQTVFFNGGFPVPTGTAPQVAFKGTSGVRQYLDVAQNSPQTQQTLVNFYANPANAARRTNYNTNLQNLTNAFQQIQQSGNLKSSAQNLVQSSINTLQSAQQQLSSGQLPDVLSVYQQIGDNLDQLVGQKCSLNQQQRGFLNTINGSLLPVGVQNYYLTPVTLSQQS